MSRDLSKTKTSMPNAELIEEGEMAKTRVLAFAPLAPILFQSPLADEKADRCGVGEINEEGRGQRQNDEGGWCRAMRFRDRRHIGDGRRSRAEANAAKTRRNDGRLGTTHHRKDNEQHIDDRHDGLDR